GRLRRVLRRRREQRPPVGEVVVHPLQRVLRGGPAPMVSARPPARGLTPHTPSRQHPPPERRPSRRSPRLLRHVWIVPALAVATASCGYLDAGAKPVVEAHRFGAAEFPQNGRAALRNALAKGWKGVELDLVLTKDRVPVVSHDPWVNQKF